jgi:hypothetical protein
MRVSYLSGVRLIGWIAAIHFLLHACAAQLVLPIPGSVDTMESPEVQTHIPTQRKKWTCRNASFLSLGAFHGDNVQSSALPKSAGGVTVKQKANKRITQMQLWQDSMFSWHRHYGVLDTLKTKRERKKKRKKEKKKKRKKEKKSGEHKNAREIQIKRPS